MGRRAFRVSDKKLKELRQEEERLAAAEKKRRAEFSAPLFGKPTRPVKLKKTHLPAQAVEATIPKKSNAMGMMGLATKTAPKVYTGDKVLGIAVMHKSNLVPIFNNAAAVEVAQMKSK